jgi:phosphate transport system substrate-binding protein
MSVSMNNTLGPLNWPIVGATYILVPKNPGDADRALNVFKFFDWAWKNGGPAADQLHYVMLPVAVQNQARARWAQVKANGQSVWK